MRVERKKAKVIETTSIPEDLAEFMKSVLESIQNRDEEAVLPSDDLLQCECCYGGLIEENGSSFEFTYFPVEDIRPKWALMLNTDEINQIADGSMKTLELWACTDKSCGCKFWEPEDSCFYCDWTGEPS